MSQSSTAVNQTITLTSDFGLKDPYVAEMKGVILTLSPNATLVDITHGVEKFNIRMGAFMLASAAPYFPKGTVHLAVVDPGVGTERRAILIQTKLGFFVGPDNGVLTLATQNQGIEHIYELDNPKFTLPKASCTFHGRDVFAPAAAHLDLGVKPFKFGPEVKDPVNPEFAIVRQRNDSFIGEVLYVDSFGNIVTNISSTEIAQAKTINVKIKELSLKFTFGKTYAQAKPQEPIALFGSRGFLEIALNQANAAEKFHLKAGDKIEVTPV